MEAIYHRLLRHYGPQGWWPAEEPFEMIVGAVLVQNCTWRGAAAAIGNLRQAGLLSPTTLHGATPEELWPLLRPAGYFRTKARKLHAFTAHLFDHRGGDLAGWLGEGLPVLRKELLGIYGIGPETADCICCYAAGLPSMPMDAYTRRVFSRLGFVPEAGSYGDLQALFHNALPADAALLGEYHALIDRLAIDRCLKTRPRCAGCPLHDLCGWRESSVGHPL